MRDTSGTRWRAVVLALAVAGCGGAEDGQSGNIVVEGFATPESVLYDAAADVYLVANINGQPTGKDDNGFIARLAPDGTITELHWIDGAAGDFELNAPKGMAISGDTLFVADIDAVRAFHRETGAPLGVREVPDAGFLNDLAVGPMGTLYATDTNTNTIYRFDAAGRPVVHIAGEPMRSPNGIAAVDDDVLVVYWGGGAARIDGMSMEVTELPAPDGERLDGVVPDSDGGYTVASWDQRAVLHVAMDGTVTPFLEDVDEPADIGWDGRRGRLLVPLFGGSVVIVPVR